MLLFVTCVIDSTYRIGYSTKYGHGFNQQINIETYEYKREYTYRPGNPRRSAERPFSGNWLEDFVDWLRIQTDSDWPGYVDEDYWEEFLQNYPEYTDEVLEWYREQGKDPPWLVPIGDYKILFLLAVLYIIKLSVIWRRT